MKRYPVSWGPFLGQAADASGGDVVCEGGVCKIVPAGAPPAPAPSLPSPASAAAAAAAASAVTSASASAGLPPAAPSTTVAGIPLPWLAVGVAAGVGALILALR